LILQLCDGDGENQVQVNFCLGVVWCNIWSVTANGTHFTWWFGL